MKNVLIEKELGATPSIAEMEVVDILVSNKVPKRLVKFLKPNRKKGSKTPDLLMDDVFWEIKSIERLGKYTLDHAERSGLKQSDSLIFDLRKLTITLEKKATTEIEREFRKRMSWKRLIIIVRYGEKCLLFSK